MSYYAKIVADSIAFGVRLTTLEVCFPRFILAEFNTHRVLSRNSASSRAIPVERRIEQVLARPFVPAAFGKNKGGMQADVVLEEREDEKARAIWLHARDHATNRAAALCDLGVHKQHANRILEPYAWHTVVVTATEWDNFFALRCHPAAQPEMQITANLMRAAMQQSTPRELNVGEWHLPYVEQSEMFYGQHDDSGIFDEAGASLRAISVARCAAVSFERQYAEKTVEQYLARHDDLLASAHMSPFEHQAQVVKPLDVPVVHTPTGKIYRWDAPFSVRYRRDTHPMTALMNNGWAEAGFFCGNFAAPWLQYRKQLPNEAVFTG